MANYIKINCSDYFIIKIRFYTSPYYLGLFRKGDIRGSIKQMESAQNFHKFFWKLIERITSNSDNHYHIKYPMSGFECAIEEIFETHQIYVQQNEGYYVFFIPKKHIDIIDWVKENVNISYKILQKTQVGLINSIPETWRRDMYGKLEIK